MSAARDLAGVARSVAERAERGEDVDVMVSTGRSTIVRVHGGEVESFTSAESFAIGIRVISDHRQGFAAAGSIDPDVIAETLAEARDNVRFGERDDCFGLAEPDGVAAVEHDHWDDALVSMSADEKIERARALEARATTGKWVLLP